jgi:hypothetical protein
MDPSNPPPPHPKNPTARTEWRVGRVFSIGCGIGPEKIGKTGTAGRNGGGALVRNERSRKFPYETGKEVATATYRNGQRKKRKKPRKIADSRGAAFPIGISYPNPLESVWIFERLKI